MKTEELLNCPFCGSTASFTEDTSPIREKIVWLVGCDSEDCPAMPLLCGHARKVDAAKAWNQRTASGDRAGIARSLENILKGCSDLQCIFHRKAQGTNGGCVCRRRIETLIAEMEKGK